MTEESGHDEGGVGNGGPSHAEASTGGPAPVQASAAEPVRAEAEKSVDDDAEWEAPPPKSPDERRGALKFDRIRLDGFKSFPDRVEIPIETGMTGIVGPNGCGKSNLLESLRWVFGETSAKRMRGAGMDDVIFGGTERRQPRNIAEVCLVADNRTRTAPPGMNDSDALEIVRRIERGQGTSYKVNGKAARMRDVQILFQDNAAGANSSAIVSQGRVGSLINSRPSDRRVVLEEAAGVSGLSSRRHDTELKLKGTEQNLTRAEDALVQSSEVLTGLRKQARQAQRRREIDGRIREAQATVLLIRKTQATRALERTRKEHDANEAKVMEAMLGVARAAAKRDAATARLPSLRESRAAAETALARATANAENMANEAERNRKAVEESERRLFELSADHKRESMSHAEAVATLAKLAEERAEIAEKREDETAVIEGASDAVEDARARVETEDANVAKLATEVATREANHATALQKRDETRRRLETVEAKLAANEARLARIQATLPSKAAMSDDEAALAEAEERLAAAGEMLAAGEEDLERTRGDEAAKQDAARSAAAALVKAQAESDGLAAVSEPGASKAPLSASLAVDPGYEAAVAAAFGESLSCGTDAGEPTSWSARATDPPKTDGRTLAAKVSGAMAARPAALAAMVVDATELARLRREGVPFGFVAVTMDGEFCRWDGLTGRRSGGAVEAALKRANRLRALEADIAKLAAAARAAQAAHAAAADAVRRAAANEAAARDEQKRAFEAARVSREKIATANKAGEETRRLLAVTESEVAAVRCERTDATSAFAAASEALAAIPQDDEARAASASAKRRLTEAREAESRAKIALERTIQEANHRRQRFEAIMREAAQWTQRREQAAAQKKEIGTRIDEVETARKEALERPAASGDALGIAQEAVDVAKKGTDGASAELAKAEAQRDSSEAALRSTESALAVLREARARLLAAIETAQVVDRSVDESISEKLGPKVRGEAPSDGDGGAPSAPRDEALERALDGRRRGVSIAELSVIAKVDPALPLDLAAAESKHARLERERESLGAVNFLAEAELAEQEKRYGDIERARAELRQTVTKLRQAIEEIDREARAKLEDAFRKIDSSFSDLFVRLFSGGAAHLKLVGSEDILDAGLEIYASPPGKRLQVLSLLSGGEQALTAMALIFAAFLSNPAPICVLDEVDAPLDDANADRLCRLVETMAADDATRFLVVTHNPLTMARMNRLYGVTMQEQGVSMVTKVDLDKAIAIIDS